MKNFAKKISLFLIFLFFSLEKIIAFDFTDITSTMGSIFYNLTNDYEGQTAFRSLLIPSGGRSESLGGAFTGLCDDACFMNYNPAASSIFKETQAAIYHNSWIADSAMETIAYTTRFGDFGLGAQLQCFYVPFTEYDITGERAASSYYTETTAIINASYNFLAGYDFKGIALGANFKTSLRGSPDFTDNDTNMIIENSGLAQSGIAFMTDIGAMFQFNFLKYFASRDPNVKIGFAVQNIGVSFTGLGSSSGLSIDDPLPTYAAAGISVKFFPFLTVTADIKQPINLFDITNYQIFSLSTGATFEFTNDFILLVGLELKGGNPRLSAGGEFELFDTRFNFNYTLDLTTSASPVNRISLSAKINLGDRGRAQIQKEIDRLYNEGLIYYYSSDWEKAIETWNKVLEINKRYDPAILGIESARSQIDMFTKVRNSMYFKE